MTARYLAALFVLSVMSACGSSRHARVSDGAGLSEGSPVIASGIQIGTVKSVALMEGSVDVEFEIDGHNEMTWREDTCALAVRGENGPGLLLMMGEGEVLADDDERAIPECQLHAPELEGLFEQVGTLLGGVLRAFGQGFSQGGPIPVPMPQLPGLAPPSPPSSQAPLPPPPNVGQGSNACEHVVVRIDSIERVAPIAGILPSGGHRAWLRFDNTSDEPVQTGPRTRARFVDRSGATLATETDPSTDAWFLPVTVAAHAYARVSVLFAGADAPELDRIEADGAGPLGQPFAECTIQASGLSAP
ncbi:MAG: MlaD family protein [Sandaracinaceae bacterium]